MKIATSISRRRIFRVATLGALVSVISPSRLSAATKGKQIVKLSKLPIGSSFNFIHSAQGMPAVLFRTKAGVFAYSAICTHQGCTVTYNASIKRLKCPCHGAEFDPLKNGSPVGGPAETPLSKVKVKIIGAWVVEA
jgi:Rieske Fe-S protein